MLIMAWNSADSLDKPNLSYACSTCLRRAACSLRPKLFTSFATLLLLLAGCISEDSAKTSHFEHDHEVAPHWPIDLNDAAVKIRERLAWSESGQEDANHEQEIAEIVSWVPEIAADTALTEQDWIPLDDAAQSLSANLRATDNELTESIREQAMVFCELIKKSVAKIPQGLASWKDSSP